MRVIRTLSSGAACNRYQLLNHIGQGAMGDVFEAYDALKQRHVALKTLHNLDGHNLSALKNEFRQLTKLNHPNLVELFELVRDESTWYFTMELIDGVEFTGWVVPGYHSHDVWGTDTSDSVSTADPVKQTASQFEVSAATHRHRVELERLRKAFCQLCAGLSTLHESGMVHRDIKPSNVLVDREGRVVLLDFGLVTEEHNLAETSPGEMVGTVAYMSPEQILAQAVTRASDWYAVGVMLYECLTGRLPFSGATAYLLMRTKVDEDGPSPREINPEIPVELDRLCRRMLMRDPQKRPTHSEITEALRGRHTSPFTTEPLIAAVPDPVEGLVGRQNALQALYGAFEKVAEQTQLIYLTGDSGQGKTSTLRQFAYNLRSAGNPSWFLMGSCPQREQITYRSLDTLMDAVGTRFSSHSSAENPLVKLPPEHRTLLLRQFPSLHRLYPYELNSVRPTQAPAELDALLAQAISELLVQMSRQRTVVLALDDLQWADDASMRVLGKLVSAPTTPPFLFVAATTQTRIPSALELAVREGERDVTLQSVRLDPLSHHDIAQMVARMNPSFAPTDAQILTLAIARASQGNPYLASELLAETRRIGATDLESTPLDLATLLGERVKSLPPRAQRVLAIVGYGSIPLTHETLLRLCQQSAAELDADLRTLETWHLVRRVDLDGVEKVQLYHRRILEALDLSVTWPQRRQLFETIATVFSQTGEVGPSRLLLYWVEAERPERVAQTAFVAAGRAQRRLAFEEEIRLLTTCLRTPQALEQRQRQTCRVRLFKAFIAVGRKSEAAMMLSEAAQHAPPEKAAVMRRRAHQLLGFSEPGD